MSQFADKTTVFIVGANSFIGRNLYVQVKRENKHNIILCSHQDIDILKTAKDEDTIINVCGVNRSQEYQDYEEGNVSFVRKIITTLQHKPFLIHVSSLMVCGFQDKQITDLPEQSQWFINTKMEGENFLKKTYPSTKLAIIRPSNIFGYDCLPYYNNILSTLIYEKIHKYEKINKLNCNSYRNMLSINGLVAELVSILEEKKEGTFNIISSNTVSLKHLIELLYNEKLPNHVSIVSSNDRDYSNTSSDVENEKMIVVEENLQEKITETEKQMTIFYDIKNNVTIKKLTKLEQPRGDMVEISDLQSSRLYKITITEGSVRGNHYHSEQIEEFYTNSGKVVYAFADKDHPNIVYIYYSQSNDSIKIYPNIIHTLSNDYANNTSEIFVTSTQKFVPNSTPDTCYVTIF